MSSNKKDKSRKADATDPSALTLPLAGRKEEKPPRWRPGPRLIRLLLLLGVSLAGAFILTPEAFLRPQALEVGQLAQRDVRAPRDVKVENERLNDEERRKAAGAQPPVFDFDEKALVRVEDKVHRFFNTCRTFYGTEDARAAGEKVPGEEPKSGADYDEAALDLPLVPPNPVKLAPDKEAALDARRGEAKEILGFDLSQKTWTALKDAQFSRGVEAQIIQIVRQVMAPGVVSSREALPDSGPIMVRKVPSNVEWRERDLDLFQDVRRAKESVPGISREWLKDAPRSLSRAIMSISQALIVPNLSRNVQETEKRKREAMAAVKPVFMQIKKGEVVIREGEKVQEEKMPLLQALSAEAERYDALMRLAIHFFLLLAGLVALYLFSSRCIKKFTTRPKDLTFLSAVLILVLLLVQMTNGWPWPYLGQVAFGTIAVRFILNSESALIFAVAASILGGVVVDYSLTYAIYSLISALLGMMWTTHIKQRLQVLWAGVLVGVITVLAICLDEYVLHGRIRDDPKLLFTYFFVTAIGAWASVLILIALLERTFGYTTDLKLLELANYDQKLLKDLSMKAPGTYQHSIMVGLLAEAAAEAIGVNALLVRVGALYHDVGKCMMPLYFTENQQGVENPHDKMNPTLSCSVIISHIKEGVRMARQENIPEVIVDMIPQHHGTSLIPFFYKKACDQADPSKGEVDEKEFRYPGPRPQTREAGILMLSDRVEAAAKTLPEYTHARLQGMVQNIINRAFSDGQLDECEITLKDLHNIAKSLIRVLDSMYHQRIEYPVPAEKVSQKKKAVDDSPDKPAKKNSDKSEEDTEERGEDLKRLGM